MTFDLPPVTTVVLHVPFFSAEVACRVRTAACLSWSLVSAWLVSGCLLTVCMCGGSEDEGGKGGGEAGVLTVGLGGGGRGG